MTNRSNHKDTICPKKRSLRPKDFFGSYFWYSNCFAQQYGVPTTTQCENEGCKKTHELATSSSKTDPRKQARYNDRIRSDLDDDDTIKSCAACLYTGVATCTGLSLYFAKLATDEVPLTPNRRFLWICSTGSFEGRPDTKKMFSAHLPPASSSI